MKILATGLSGPADELGPLRDAGHEVLIGRPLDQPGRKAYTEAELIESARDIHVILASHLETISRGVLESAADLDALIRREISARKSKATTVTANCSSCGARNPTTNKFCAECGAKLKR